MISGNHHGWNRSAVQKLYSKFPVNIVCGAAKFSVCSYDHRFRSMICTAVETDTELISSSYEDLTASLVHCT